MKILWAFGLFLLLILYSPGFAEPFFLIDDHSLIGAPQVKVFDAESLKSIFEFGNHVDYMPVRELSYLLDWQWGIDLENNLTPVRLQNFAWFFGISFLLAQVLQIIGLGRVPAYALSLIWALHPIHAELFMWGAARKDLLSIFGALTVFYFFVYLFKQHKQMSDKRKILLLLIMISMTLFSVFAKATFVILPLIAAIFLWEKLPLRTPHKILITIWVAIDLVAIVIHKRVYTLVNPMSLQLTLAYRLEALTSAFGRTLCGLFWPPSNIIDIYNWGEWVHINRFYLYIGAPTLLAFLIFLIFSLGILPIRTVMLSGRLAQNLSGEQRSSHRVSIFNQAYSATQMYLQNSSGSFGFSCVAVGLLAVTPGFNSSHRAFYSIRYYEPLILVSLIYVASEFKSYLNSLILTSWRNIFTFALVLGVMTVTQIWESQNWHSNLAIVEKSLASSPDNPSIKTLVLQEIYNLKRWGRTTKAQFATAQDMAESLSHQCLDSNLDMTNGTLCFHFLKDFRRFKVFLNSANFANQAESAIRLLAKSQVSTGEILKTSNAAVRDGSSYTPTPFSRVLSLQRVCRLSGTEASKTLTRKFIRKHLLSRDYLIEIQTELANEKQRNEFQECVW